MKKVTIINAYGDKNIGDATILNVAIDFIKKAHTKDCQISVLCESKTAIHKSVGLQKNITPFQLPYGYAIRSDEEKVPTITKIYRFLSIFLVSSGAIFLNLLFKIKLTKSGFYSYISAIKDADMVVGMGGGYFITKTTKDYFGLLLTLLPVYIAKIYKKKIVFLPISFGPFATKSQEDITYHALRNTTVIARDKITLNQLKLLDQDKKIRLSFAPDLALFFNIQKSNLKQKLASSYITLTARDWLVDKSKQQGFETAITHFVDAIWKKYNLQTKFIPMAKNQIEDNDVNLALRIRENLKQKKIFHIISPKSIVHVQNVISGARIAVCTRMHSAILATTVQTPFIAIGYGHKTKGFVKNLRLEKWHIDITDVSETKLNKMFSKLIDIKNYTQFTQTISLRHNEYSIYKNKIINLLEVKMII